MVPGADDSQGCRRGANRRRRRRVVRRVSHLPGKPLQRDGTTRPQAAAGSRIALGWPAARVRRKDWVRLQAETFLTGVAAYSGSRTRVLERYVFRGGKARPFPV